MPDCGYCLVQIHSSLLESVHLSSLMCPYVRVLLIPPPCCRWFGTAGTCGVPCRRRRLRSHLTWSRMQTLIQRVTLPAYVPLQHPAVNRSGLRGRRMSGTGGEEMTCPALAEPQQGQPCTLLLIWGPFPLQPHSPVPLS